MDKENKNGKDLQANEESNNQSIMDFGSASIKNSKGKNRKRKRPKL